MNFLLQGQIRYHRKLEANLSIPMTGSFLTKILSLFLIVVIIVYTWEIYSLLVLKRVSCGSIPRRSPSMLILILLPCLFSTFVIT